MKTRRSVPLDSLSVMQDVIDPEGTPIGAPDRIPGAMGEVADTLTVKYSDIDVNTHANSLHYVRWISDCFSIEFYWEHFILRFEINFLHVLTIGDTGDVHRQPGEAG